MLRTYQPKKRHRSKVQDVYKRQSEDTFLLRGNEFNIKEIQVT